MYNPLNKPVIGERRYVNIGLQLSGKTATYTKVIGGGLSLIFGLILGHIISMSRLVL